MIRRLRRSSRNRLTGLIRALVAAASLAPAEGWAQNWSFDARNIALGSPGGRRNLASEMVAEERGYHTFVLPFGLIQLVRDFDLLNPGSDNFDLVRTVEYAASPIHYMFGRSSGRAAHEFVVDVRNASLIRDLQPYRGFTPANQPRAEGLAFPQWGRIFRVRSGERSSFQGVYVGAGPYLSLQSDLLVDQQLIEVLGDSGSTARLPIPNSQLRAGSGIRGQLALGITGGYRAHFSAAAAEDLRDGVYVAANYSVLRGFRYEDLRLALRLDTDRLGLLTVDPLLPSPLLITRDQARSGIGGSIDFGVAFVDRRWEYGFGANGIANRIVWHGVRRTTYAHANLLSGNSDFVESGPQPAADARITLPVDYRANLGYDAGRSATFVEVTRGFGGTAFHGGVEYRLSTMELRTGAMYVRGLWSPAAGVGIDLSAGRALDVAVYANAANVERERRPTVAVSLRFSSGR